MRKITTTIFLACVISFLQPLNAQTWDSIKRLTWNSGGSYHASIATDSSDNIHIVWYDQTPGNNEIYYKKSTDGGTTWFTKRLTWNSGNSVYPNIGIDSSDNIFIVWHDFSASNLEIFFQKSTDGGISWSSKRLTWSSGYSYYPNIAADSSNNIHLVWYDNTVGNYEIYYKKSTNGGITWTTKRLTWSPGSSKHPAITPDSSGNIYVVWHDETPGNNEIYYKKSTNGGTTWTTKRLTWSPEASLDADISTDSIGNIHVVWQDLTPGNYELYYKQSTDGGASWTSKRLNWNTGFSYNPSFDVDSNDYIHIIWFDTTPIFREIYHKRSIDHGASWSTKQLTFTEGDSQFPEIASDSNSNIHVVWHDDVSSNFEIYYIKGIQ